MCDPMTLAVAGMAVSGVAQMSAANKQAAEMRKQGKKQERVAAEERREAEMDLRDERKTGLRDRARGRGTTALTTGQLFAGRSFFTAS